ncbi:MAG: DUF417 family protein, partial [Citrobacter freundii]
LMKTLLTSGCTNQRGAGQSGQDSHTGFPYLSGAGRLVLKDTIMMAAGLIAMVHSAKCILAQNQHERDYTGKVSAGLR